MDQTQQQQQQQQQQQHQQQQRPIKYGDVFAVSEAEVAEQLIAPKDAAAMQSSEKQVLGHTQKGGSAAVMQSAATKNVEAGLLPPDSASDAGLYQGMTVTQSVVDGRQVVTESIGDQVVAKYADPNPDPEAEAPPAVLVDGDAVTIGEAVEASALSAGDKPITQSDAAAVQAAEMLAIGTKQTPPGGGLGSEAQAAAAQNSRIDDDKNKITLGQVLGDASIKMAEDKPVTLQDAERVIGAELRNNSEMATEDGGVGNSLAAAARLNQQKYNNEQ